VKSVRMIPKFHFRCLTETDSRRLDGALPPSSENDVRQARSRVVNSGYRRSATDMVSITPVRVHLVCCTDSGPATMVKMPVQKIKMAVIAVAEFVTSRLNKRGLLPQSLPRAQARPAKPHIAV